MESRENMTPAVETIAPEAPSSYQLAQRTDSPTAQIGNPSQTMGPLGFSPVAGGMPSSLAKKKRGRPRKYGPDGVGASGGASGRTLSPMPLSAASSPPTSGGYSDIKFGEPTGSGGEFQVEKKKKRKINSLEAKSNMSPDDRITSGGSFTPHMVTVNPGEDVTSKIISFSKYGPRAVCVLSALGIISHVTLRQASSSGGTVTYEGRFEILSLSGSFTPGEVGGLSSREGGMSIALSSPDGRVVGGLLGGLLTAAGPVQVVVASFLPEIGTPAGPKPKKKKDAIKLLTPVADPTTVPRTTNTDHQNFNDKSQESPAKGNTNSTPASNFQHENRSTGPNVHDWRRAATDMNVSLRED
ncbi:AT-hook motif nuclear-localized protein 1-like [Cynara cardunculus var. scolymus]|uniref:AT-hook motif nuclear-localized protein 1-like n=1 Tax=Cynara cardunculus var. scolymus TaxID=59895 RepID=UPI000D62584F|nr:AT-hook motif nuclear-localized protein 1-like [Cynara cardunculus var. scolymus]